MEADARLNENIAALGLELASRGQAFQEFYTLQNDGWLDTTRFVVRTAESFTDAENRATDEYDWVIAMERFVDRLIDLSKRGQLMASQIPSAASDSILGARY